MIDINLLQRKLKRSPKNSVTEFTSECLNKYQVSDLNNMIDIKLLMTKLEGLSHNSPSHSAFLLKILKKLDSNEQDVFVIEPRLLKDSPRLNIEEHFLTNTKLDLNKILENPFHYLKLIENKQWQSVIKRFDDFDLIEDPSQKYLLRNYFLLESNLKKCCPKFYKKLDFTTKTEYFSSEWFGVPLDKIHWGLTKNFWLIPENIQYLEQKLEASKEDKNVRKDVCFIINELIILFKTDNQFFTDAFLNFISKTKNIVNSSYFFLNTSQTKAGKNINNGLTFVLIERLLLLDNEQLFNTIKLMNKEYDSFSPNNASLVKHLQYNLLRYIKDKSKFKFFSHGFYYGAHKVKNNSKLNAENLFNHFYKNIPNLFETIDTKVFLTKLQFLTDNESNQDIEYFAKCFEHTLCNNDEVLTIQNCDIQM